MPALGVGRRPAQVPELAGDGHLHQESIALSPGSRRAGHRKWITRFWWKVTWIALLWLPAASKMWWLRRHEPDGRQIRLLGPLHAARSRRITNPILRVWRRRSACWPRCWKRALKPKCWRCRKDLDPDESPSASAALAVYADLLKNAPSYLDYLTERAAKTHDIGSPEGKEPPAKCVLPVSQIKRPTPCCAAELASPARPPCEWIERLLRDELRRAASEKRTGSAGPRRTFTRGRDLCPQARVARVP